MDGQTDGRTDGWRENLPILQDFVPYRGRCPAQLQPKNYIKRGKGTADHMMPGDCTALTEIVLTIGAANIVPIVFSTPLDIVRDANNCRQNPGKAEFLEIWNF